MSRSAIYLISLMLLSTSPALLAQDVWSNLRRSTFDVAALVLRVPCATLEDAAGNALAGYAPAYALNLALVGDVLELVEPIAAFDTTPEVCLDRLQLSEDGTTAVYETSSAQVDADQMAGISRFYTLQLEANLNAGNATRFRLLSESSRFYQRAIWNGSIFDVIASDPLAVFDDLALNAAEADVFSNLIVFEPGNYDVNCEYYDPFDLIEVFEVVGDNVRSRLRSGVTSARNGQSISVDCTVTNRQLNFLDVIVDSYTLIQLGL